MTLPWRQLEQRIAEAERILLTTHVRPDGDALGSELAMADLLIQKGKEVEIFNASPTPLRYQFLDSQGARIGFLRPGVEGPTLKPDLLLVLDTGTWSQLAGLAPYFRASTAAKVVIDHHASQDDLGALRLVDVSASACGMLVYEAFHQFGGEITPAAATAMFLAIATDTGWMRHSNTTAAVLKTLGELELKGAIPHELFREMYDTNSPQRLRLLGIMLGKLQVLVGGRLAVSAITQSDIKSVGAHPMDTEDFINHLMSIAGVETAAFFIEQAEGGTKVSFRSRGTLDCSKLAEQFGGGGHRPAAGASLTTPLAEAQPAIIAALEKAMSTGN